MNILHHWALMAANALTLMGLMITLYEQGLQSYHWTFFVLVPIWVYLIDNSTRLIGTIIKLILKGTLKRPLLRSFVLERSRKSA